MVRHSLEHPAWQHGNVDLPNLALGSPGDTINGSGPFAFATSSRSSDGEIRLGVFCLTFEAGDSEAVKKIR